MKSKSLGKNAIYNVVGQISSLVFSVILMPYLTRTLGSEGYGKYNYCLSICGYFLSVSALGISAYAIREISAIRENREKAYEIGRELFSLNILSAIIAYGLFFLMLVIWRPVGAYRDILLILSLEIVFRTIGRSWIYSAYEDFRFATIESILIHALRTAAIFLFVKSQDDLAVYAGITSTCAALLACIDCLYTSRYMRYGVTLDMKLSQHLAPVLIIFMSAITTSVYLDSDITMLGIFRGDVDVGIYKVSTQVYTMVKTMLNAIVAVMIPRMSFLYNQNRDNDFTELTSRSVSMIVLLVIPALSGLYMIADDVVFLLAGEEYMAAVGPLRVLSFALLCAIVGNICSNGVLLTIRKEKLSFLISLISAGVNILLNLFLIRKYSYIGAAITTVIAEIVVLTLGLVWSRRYISFAVVLKRLLIAVLGSAGVILACSWISTLGWGHIPDMIAKILLSCICYGVIVWLIPDTRGLIKSLWAKSA